MDFIYILFMASIIGIWFPNPTEWFKPDYDKETDKEEMGWIERIVINIFLWFVTLIILRFAFTVIKLLWNNA